MQNEPCRVIAPRENEDHIDLVQAIYVLLSVACVEPSMSDVCGTLIAV